MSYKRLDRGTFKLPEPLAPGANTVVIEDRALDDLLDGIDIEVKPRRKRATGIH